MALAETHAPDPRRADGNADTDGNDSGNDSGNCNADVRSQHALGFRPPLGQAAARRDDRRPWYKDNRLMNGNRCALIERLPVCVLIFVWLCMSAACEKRSLRGRVEASPDGKTYLSIDDDNGGGCPIFVDGKRWSQRLGQAVAIAAGPHTVTFACGSLKQGSPYPIEVRRGTIFHFDYWGP